MSCSERPGCQACPNRATIDGSRPLVVALVGNPNVGKSTVFNGLTGLDQHTGNWPGKTVAVASGTFIHAGRQIVLTDLPGTYSLHPGSPDEAVTRDHLATAAPDCVVVVVDATCLERNLNLVLQVQARSPRVVLCVNLLDEARRQGIDLDLDALARRLDLPVVGTAARAGRGLGALRSAIVRCANDQPRPPSPLAGDDSADNFHRAAALVADCQRQTGGGHHWQARIDGLLTHPIWGWPAMLACLAVVLWLTVVGANIPSGLIAGLLIEDQGLDTWWQTYLGGPPPEWLQASLFVWLHRAAAALALPTWLSGITIDGIYLCVAWVVSVMLPPMAIFFPLFTLLEDAGYLPRIAFNLDPLLQRCGSHGKQALTMAMGFGCNAAGVVSCRIIDAPHERLLAIITNSFMVCNGRFPTVIAIAGLLIAGGIASPMLAASAAAGVVIAVVLLGIVVALLTTWLLSRTVLRGLPSGCTLELPPYRRPAWGQVLRRSFRERTLPVLGRACLVSAPAGLLIWLLANCDWGGEAIGLQLADWLDPLGRHLGLSGIVLIAFLMAVPANEIVVPVIIMLLLLTGSSADPTLPGGRMVALDGEALHLLLRQHGWTTQTAICMLLLVLLHNPCGTTILTIWRETGSRRWTLLASFLPLIIGLGLCFLVSKLWDGLA